MKYRPKFNAMIIGDKLVKIGTIGERFKHITPKVKVRRIQKEGYFLLEFHVWKKPFFMGWFRKRRWICAGTIHPDISDVKQAIIDCLKLLK